MSNQSQSGKPWPGRLEADPSLTTTDGGRVLIGGSPLTVLRFAGLIDLDTVSSPAVIDRLVDTGMAHPDPSTGPYASEDVTVVIPTYGHPEALAATLAALNRHGEALAAVIVVDDASPDPTAIATVVDNASPDPRRIATVVDAPLGRAAVAEVVAAADQDDTDLAAIRLIRRERNGGPAAARNSGLEAVTTALVAFVDAGCVPLAGWLDPLLAQFADENVALAAPRVRADPDRVVAATVPRRVETDTTQASAPRRIGGTHRWIRRTVARYEAVRSSLDRGPTPARVAPRTRVSYVPSACIVVRVDVLREIGGFDESLPVGEDVDLVWRLGAHSRARYVPAATVTHDVRDRPWAWTVRRFTYGTSAAPLALRHPGALAPVAISPWTAAAWTSVATGHPAIGVGIATLSTALLIRKLDGLDEPVPVALRLAGLGNLAAGRLLADALRRTWWPCALAGAVSGPRALRRTIAAAFVVAPLLEWRPSTGLDPVSWLILRLADDLAYGAGVWVGCVREGTIAPLVPDFGAGRVR